MIWNPVSPDEYAIWHSYWRIECLKFLILVIGIYPSTWLRVVSLSNPFGICFLVLGIFPPTKNVIENKF